MYLPHISDFNSSQQDDTGSRQGSRGDSAVSEFTTDSGVVLYTGEVPTLPRAVPWKLPPLVCVCVCVKECMLVRDLVCVPLPAHIPSLVHESGERPRSSEILEQLLIPGRGPAGRHTTWWVPAGQSKV